MSRWVNVDPSRCLALAQSGANRVTSLRTEKWDCLNAIQVLGLAMSTVAFAGNVSPGLFGRAVLSRRPLTRIRLREVTS